MSQLTVGADGQLYGTTQLGGAANMGTVFKVTTNGVLTTLASFTNSANALPVSGLLRASDGNFYGCTQGAVFKVSPDGLLTTVASLMPLDGLNPQAGLTLGPDGNFYGTTRAGGSNNFGTIFRLRPGGTLTRMFAFNVTNGAFPQSTIDSRQGREFLRHHHLRRQRELRGNRLSIFHQRNIDHPRVVRQYQQWLQPGLPVVVRPQRQSLRYHSDIGPRPPRHGVSGHHQRRPDDSHQLQRPEWCHSQGRPGDGGRRQFLWDDGERWGQ